MKARLEFKIKKMFEESNSVVLIQGDVLGSVESDEVKNPEAKIFVGEISLRVKPVVAQHLSFGQKLYFSMSDKEPVRK